jgi:hypothetical protein
MENSITKKPMTNKKQTAVDFLEEQILLTSPTVYKLMKEANDFNQAKEIQKQQIELTAIKCHFEGVRQKAKTSQEYIEYGEKYYKETYEQ